MASTTSSLGLSTAPGSLRDRNPRSRTASFLSVAARSALRGMLVPGHADDLLLGPARSLAPSSDRSYASSHLDPSPSLASRTSSRFPSSPRSPRPSSSRPSSSSSAEAVRHAPVGRLVTYLLATGRSLSFVLVALGLLVGLSKWLAGLGSHSGYRNPPMYGDFEAQRHWLEITTHLPMREWYFFDLQYWGLDYPPLTAFHSLALGKLAHALAPAWVALGASRGCETPGLRAFMRAAALAGEVAVWWSACWAWVAWDAPGQRKGKGRSRRELAFLWLLLVSQPALTLVDSAHFQFNSLMLGLALWAVVLLRDGRRDGLACVLFVGALAFKQIALYWAPAVGIWLVGKCWNLGRVDGTRLFIKLGLCTVLSFGTALAPFAYAGFSAPAPSGGLHGALVQVAQVGHRVFPFARGLFEDKVANFWCATNIVVKWRTLIPPSLLPPLALALTALALLPSSLNFLYLAHALPSGEGSFGRDRLGRLLPVLVEQASLSFFLCAFQVHEKAILLPLLGVMLEATSAKPDGRGLTRERIGWVALWQSVAVFSMWPLLQRDGVALQYAVLSAMWTWAVGGWAWWTAPRARPASSARAGSSVGSEPDGAVSARLFYASLLAYGSLAILHAFELAVPPPASKPDLHAVLNVLFAFACFLLAWADGVGRAVREGWGLLGVGSAGEGRKTRKEI